MQHHSKADLVSVHHASLAFLVFNTTRVVSSSLSALFFVQFALQRLSMHTIFMWKDPSGGLPPHK